jgi:hypothetical protein
MEIAMYEDQTKSTSGQARPGQVRPDPSRGDSSARRTDPKFARESFTMRRMQRWQIVALAIAAVVVIGLAVLYF